MPMKRKVMVVTASQILFGGTPSGGVSPEAISIQKQSGDWWNGLQALEFLGSASLLAELDGLAEECVRPNWDGYEAEPVIPESIEHARSLLRALPMGMAPPKLGVEPDGQVTLEWYASPRRVLSVSMSPDGDLHYAALIGPTRQFGTEPFFGEIPRAIVELIRRVGRG